MLHKRWGNTPYISYTESYGIDCENREDEYHKNLTKPTEAGDECVICHGALLDKLPWKRPFGEASAYDDDDALLKLLRVPDDMYTKNRRTVVYAKCGPDKSNADYICEDFGIDIGEVEGIDSYPYWRISKKEKPNFLITLFRQRFCYTKHIKPDNPQIAPCRIYLEVIRNGFRRDINLRGLDTVSNLTPEDIRPLMRLRAWLKSASDGWELNMDNLPEKLRPKFKKLIEAAERLAQRDNPRFSILNLCNSYGGENSKRQSRDIYYKFIRSVNAQSGPEIADRVERKIREAYDLARDNPRPKDESKSEVIEKES